MLGRPSAAEIVQVTNFVGPMYGLSEVISWTCGEVRMNSLSAVLSVRIDRVQSSRHCRRRGPAPRMTKDEAIAGM